MTKLVKDLTELLLPQADVMDEHWTDGALHGLQGEPLDESPARTLARNRAAWGAPERYAPILTAPADNAKLAKSKERLAYGLQLMHHVSRVSPKLVVNSCPFAGDCVAVCVARNGMNRWTSSQRAQRTRTALLAEEPYVFSWIVGWELGRAVRLHGPIFFRPNVYSDVAWELLWPSMTNGSVLDLVAYGYTKRPSILETDGWLGSHYRVAYSWNESSHATKVGRFLRRGGSVAIVTNRRKGEEVEPLPFWGDHKWVDGDRTDEWLFEAGVIGDIAAKVRARTLDSGFIVRR